MRNMTADALSNGYNDGCPTKKRWVGRFFSRKPALDEHEDLFLIGTSPHIRDNSSISRIMAWVIVALIPVTAWGIYIGGVSALLTIVMSILGCVVAEAIVLRIRKMPIVITDLSAVLTGLLLALTLPPKMPLWIPFLGGMFAIIVGKQLFGGLGHNIFNPALIGRAFIFVSWTSQMNNAYLDPLHTSVSGSIAGINAVTTATPLTAVSHLRTGELAKGAVSATDYIEPLLFRNPWGTIGEVSAVLLLVGLAILLITRIIDWRIPFFYVGTVVLLTWINMLVTPEKGMNLIFCAISGGLFLGAFFMATDYVTGPMTSWGKIIFACGCGIVTFVLRFYSSMPEGVMFSILFMNATTPLIDRYLKPRPFGWKREKVEETAA